MPSSGSSPSPVECAAIAGGPGIVPLVEGWQLCLTDPGRFATPASLPARTDWLSATVPGTAAQALRAHGRWNPGAPTPLHERDVWYRLRFDGAGEQTLRFDGLAGLVELWLNEAPLGASENMFVAFEQAVTLRGDNTLHLCFRALARAVPPAGCAGGA